VIEKREGSTWIGRGPMRPEVPGEGRDRRYVTSRWAALGWTQVASVAKELQLGVVDPDELTWVITSELGHSQAGRDDEVIFSADQNGPCALSLHYDKKGVLRDVRTGPAFTDQLLEAISGRVESALLADEWTVVRRNVMFSGQVVEGYWKHGDVLQMLPAPTEFPKPPQAFGDHPFILEFPVRASPDPFLEAVRATRRSNELRLVLSAVCLGRITVSSNARQHWAMVFPRDMTDDSAEVETRWVQEGYSPPTFSAREHEFSVATDRLEVIPFVASDAYFSIPALKVSEALTLPECLPQVIDKLDGLDPAERELFLRACYWIDQATQVWPHSRSLAYLALITAVETIALGDDGPLDDFCPECGANRAPGPTARFKAFVEKYAGSVPVKVRDDLYGLRGKLVHGRRLLESDVAPWRMSLDPLSVEQRNLQTMAFMVARVAVINWLLLI
jgi:hypothetical protein